MRKTACWYIVLLVALAVGLPDGALALGADQPQPAQDEFVPMEQIPPEDQLPAAPLLIVAYAFVWLSVFGYLWSIWRRLSAVEKELSELSRRKKE